MQTQNLFGTVHSYDEKETIFWIVKKINNMKPKSQDRRGDSVKRTKNVKTSTVKRCLSTTKDQVQHIKGAKENKQPVRVICWS